AFEDAPVTIQAGVAASGFDGSEIVTRLTEEANSFSCGSTNSTNPPGLQLSANSNLVAELTQRATGNEANLNFRFQIQPDKPGIHFYQVETRQRSELDHPNIPS